MRGFIKIMKSRTKIMHECESVKDGEDFDYFDTLIPRSKAEIKDAILMLDDQIKYHQAVARN